MFQSSNIESEPGDSGSLSVPDELRIHVEVIPAVPGGAQERKSFRIIMLWAVIIFAALPAFFWLAQHPKSKNTD